MELFTIENKNGALVRITNYGGRIVNLLIPDRTGHHDDIVLGYDIPDAYLTSGEKYYGAIIGRYGNRIGGAKFEINGVTYKLGENNGTNSLHGGNHGFHNVIWDVKKNDSQTLELTYFSKDGEEGFPGNLNVRVVYCLTNNNELKIEYSVSTDKPTIVNLTHHSFFNLSGDLSKTINNHILQIPASSYTPIDEWLIPTGEIENVEETPFDFRKPKIIGERINTVNKQIEYGAGYDHNWVLNREESRNQIRLAAMVTEPVSGRRMEVLTNEPGIQFYSGNFLNGKDVGKNKIPYNYRTAFCLETQHFPDSPNKKHFPGTLLKPGEKYYSICIYRFSTVL